MGRYGDSTLADVTANASWATCPVHNVSGLLTVEANPTPRLAIYLNYGGDYAGREDFAALRGAQPLGAPTATSAPPRGQHSPAPAPQRQRISPPAANGAVTGVHPHAAAVGYGSRLLNNSACNTIANPGYNGGGSTGYIPGGSCGAQTRDVQEITGGYWYDIYKGDRGRFRQGIQYGYAVREGWSGAPSRRRPRNWRQGHRQHVLDLVPLLPAVDANDATRILNQKGQLAMRVALSASLRNADPEAATSRAVPRSGEMPLPPQHSPIPAHHGAARGWARCARQQPPKASSQRRV